MRPKEYWIVIVRNADTPATVEYWCGDGWRDTPDVFWRSCEQAGQEMDRAGLHPGDCRLSLIADT